jgi:molybdate transport system regulatory protein
MAGPKGSKYYDIFLKHNIQLVTRDEKSIISEEGFNLLLEVRNEESIVSAARNLGMSYRKAWGLLRDTERILGLQLVGKHRGGKAGGKTYLTGEGIQLVGAYSSLLEELDRLSHDHIRAFFNRINEISESK